MCHLRQGCVGGDATAIESMGRNDSDSGLDIHLDACHHVVSRHLGKSSLRMARSRLAECDLVIGPIVQHVGAVDTAQFELGDPLGPCIGLGGVVVVYFGSLPVAGDMEI